MKIPASTTLGAQCGRGYVPAWLDVADTIVRTVELGVTITHSALPKGATVLFCDLLIDGPDHLSGMQRVGLLTTDTSRIESVQVIGVDEHRWPAPGARSATGMSP